MVNGIRTSDPSWLGKGCGLKFCVGSRVRQTPEEDQKIYQLKHCEYNTEDEDNRLKTLNDIQMIKSFVCVCVCVCIGESNKHILRKPFGDKASKLTKKLKAICILEKLCQIEMKQKKKMPDVFRLQ